MSNIFIGAILFSIWFTILFIGKSIGLSMLLFILPITVYLLYILKKNNKNVNNKALILLVPIILLSSTYFIFNNALFRYLNLFIIPTLVAAMIVIYIDKKLSAKMLIVKILEVIFRPIDFLGETIITLEESLEKKFKNKNADKPKKKNGKIIKGILITIPIALFVLILLATADEIFGKIFIDTFKAIIIEISKWNLYGISLRIVAILLSFLYLAAFIYTLTLKYDKGEEETKQIKEKDNTTIKIILGTLNVMYLFFCIVQIKSLFIGKVNVNYSQYARQGFFQLMIVSIINIITILIAKKSIKKETKVFNYINIMSIIMIIFTFIILISSAVRMHFYESAFGYTYLRLLVYCVLITEAIMLIPTIIYIIKPNIELAKIYLAIMLIVYLGMNYANFDKMIAKRNIERYEETGKIDIEYLTMNTQTDAIEEIVEILEIDDINEEIKTKIEIYLQDLNEKLDKETDFRDFNISKQKAKEIIEDTI